MKIPMRKFGLILSSRPAGREAASVILSYFKASSAGDLIELDFEGVIAVGPSWLDEVMRGLQREQRNAIKILDAGNASVIESIKFLESLKQ